MALTALPLPALARGASWLWRSAGDQLTRSADPLSGAKVPVGVVLDHGDHESFVMWAVVAGYGGQFTVDSLQPLTVNEPVLCPVCALHGMILAGQWVPSSTSKGATA